jgi:thiamine kinase-like enzyme
VIVDDLEATLRQVPGWGDASITIRPLAGGITNRNYAVTVDGRVCVVRIPGERAAELGIAPPVVARLPGHTTLITEFVAGSHATSDADFVTPPRLERVVALLKTFHRSGSIEGQFPIFRIVEWHARDAAANGVTPPPLYDWLHERSAAIEAAFDAAPMSPVPCHNDLLPANVLFDNERVWLLDFEYAGMNDLFFDLGNLSANSAFDDETDRELLALYFGVSTPSRWARLQLMKIMSEFREGMWAVVQQAISTLDTDFVGYANERLGRCRTLVEQAPFDEWLAAAAQPA